MFLRNVCRLSTDYGELYPQNIVLCHVTPVNLVEVYRISSTILKSEDRTFLRNVVKHLLDYML
jgi:hypothetical protein